MSQMLDIGRCHPSPPMHGISPQAEVCIGSSS
jgi:hypothetical protein